MARTRAQDYDEKRQVILKRAAELFAEKGFVGASIMMIADACGVSKALLYHYYRDKEAVLVDIIESHLKELIDVVDAAAEGQTSGRAQLEAICAALLEAYRDADAEHQVQIANLKLLRPAKQAKLKALQRQLVERFSEAIAAALPDVAKDPSILKPLTMSLFGMLNWHYLWFREGGDLTRSEYARLVSELIIAGGRKVARTRLTEVS